MIRQENHSSKGLLYLVPNTLGNTPENNTIPEYVLNITRSLDVLIVENIQTARKFLQWVGNTVPEYEIQFYVLNKHTPVEEITGYLDAAKEGKNIGVISEAGCPGVADPGTSVVRLAHSMGIKVVPLVGPNSMLLALMASGFNGQSYAFWGYLPIEPGKRSEKIKELEKQSREWNRTEIFMEAPHRNNEILRTVVETCDPETRLCTATDITLPEEQIISQKIGDWQHKIGKTDIDKRPTVFLLYAARQTRPFRSSKSGRRRK